MERMRSVIAQGFSLISGGPFYDLLQWAGLIKPGAYGLLLRCAALLALAWLPLVVITAFQGTLVGDVSSIPFLLDISANTRLLVAMPLLLAAEQVIEPRARAASAHFLDSGLVGKTDFPAFEKAIQETMRETHSSLVELVAVLVIIALDLAGLRMEMHAANSSWQATVTATEVSRTAAGWWHAVVSISLFQFLVFRWLWRLFIWARFLWRMSRLDLNLIPTHPDAAAGLGFLNGTQAKFAIIALALSSVAAGNIAARILFGHSTFAAHEGFAIALVAINACVILSPLLVFMPKLAAAKRKGLLEYGVLAMRYVSEFDEKWLRQEDAGAELLGSGDIQSLADLGNSYAIIRSIRITLIDMASVKAIVIATALPILPLYMAKYDVKELLKRATGLLF